MENSECVYLECSRSAHVLRRHCLCRELQSRVRDGFGKFRIGVVNLISGSWTQSRQPPDDSEAEAMKKFLEATPGFFGSIQMGETHLHQSPSWPSGCLQGGITVYEFLDNRRGPLTTFSTRTGLDYYDSSKRKFPEKLGLQQ